MELPRPGSPRPRGESSKLRVGGVPATVRRRVGVLGLQGTGLSKTWGYHPAYSDGAGLWLEQGTTASLGTPVGPAVQHPGGGAQRRPTAEGRVLRGAAPSCAGGSQEGSKEGSEPLPLRGWGGAVGGSRGWDPGCGGSSGMGEGGDIPKGVECPPCHGPVLTPCGVPLESKPAPSSPGPTANNLTRKSGLPKNTQAATGHERAHRFLPHQALLCHPTPDPPRQERQAPTRTGTQDPWREAHRFPPSGKAGIRVWLSVRGQGLGSEGSHPNSKPAHERQDAPPQIRAASAAPLPLSRGTRGLRQRRACHPPQSQGS